ncbi:MAG: divergent PAP2 family protein [Candidatus Omnitrophota bacterium]|nr:MAG: divergent PAP2 family protein [Candidatus Omnitrophota bacterium]
MQIQTSNFWTDIITNRILIASFFSWGGAQCIKIFSGLLRKERFNFKWIMVTGGMPSAHSASVSSLAASTGMVNGFGSVIFAVTAVFSLIIMFDAQGLRRMAGLQAEALNRLIEDIYSNTGMQQQHLREVLGHTPVEVLMGAILGIFIAIIVVTF